MAIIPTYLYPKFSNQYFIFNIPHKVYIYNTDSNIFLIEANPSVFPPQPIILFKMPEFELLETFSKEPIPNS